jgi:ribonuclease HII
VAPRPTLVRERAAWREGRLLVGVDEVGRGPLAGPVVAAAVVFPEGCRNVRGLRDSKVLPERRRDRLAAVVRARALAIGLGAASVREIDRLNIRVASAVAMRRAVCRCLAALSRLGRVEWPDRAVQPGRAAARGETPERVPARCWVLIDGLPLPELGLTHEALVDGDARCHSVAAAAVVAKTVRDALMRRLAIRYPGYGWESNVGYGTESHQIGLRLLGPTRHHRRSFFPIAQIELDFELPSELQTAEAQRHGE